MQLVGKDRDRGVFINTNHSKDATIRKIALARHLQKTFGQALLKNKDFQILLHQLDQKVWKIGSHSLGIENTPWVMLAG
jgi:hypothetical protein